MLYDKIGKFFNIMTTPISHNGNVKRDLWTLNDKNYNITSQMDYPFIYDQNSIQELLVKFNKVKFKDISSMNSLPKQKYFDRFLCKMPDLKRDSSYHSKLYDYNLTTLEEENDQKMNKKYSINNDRRRSKKKKQREKYFKIQLSDMEKRRSIKFDLHPMVEKFMNRTMDKLTANIPKEKQYKRKTKKGSDDEDEVREKLRIMQVLKDLQKEEEEEKKRKKQSSQLLSVSSNLPTSDDLLHEDDGAGKLEQTTSPVISSSLSKSVNSSVLQTVSTSEQSGAVDEPASNKIDGDVDNLERKLSVFDPDISDSPVADYTTQRPAKVEKMESQLHMSNNVGKQEMESKELNIFDRKEIGVLYDSKRDKAVGEDKKETTTIDEKEENKNLDVQNVDKTQNNKSVISIDKSTSSHDLMKKDATTITEPNSKTRSTIRKKTLHFSDIDHIVYPLYSIQESRTENNIYKQIEISPSNKHKKINIIENNNILNLEQTGKNTITDLQFSHQKIPNKNVLYFNYKSPLFQIKLKEFLKNNLEEKREDLIYGRSTGDVEIPYRLNRENITDIPKIKEENSSCYRLNRENITGIPKIKKENSSCYNNMKTNITKKHSRISTIKRSKIIRKLAAACAYPSIKSTNVGVAKSYNKGNKLYFNSKVLFNSEKTNVYNKIDKTVVNQCVNGINKKNEIAQTLRRINSLRDVSDNLENFLKDLSRIKEDEPRIGTITCSHFKESRTKSGQNSNNGNRKHSGGVRNEPPNNDNKHTFPKNCQHIIMPVYINIDTFNEDWESSENENSSETNSVSSKTFPKTTMIPAAPKRVYLENFRKPNKEIVNKVVNAEQSKQYNNSLILNENADGEQGEIKSMKLYNSISQCLISKTFLESTMFMRKENSIEQRIDYDLGTKKQETSNVRNGEERYEIIQFTGSNAVTESNYLLNNENSNSNNQSTIQLNVNCQNFKIDEFDSYTDLYTNKITLPKCTDNVIVTEEQTGHENYVNNEIKDDNIFEQQKNSNHSKQSITNSNVNNNYFKHKKTKQIFQENQPYETTDPVYQRKPSSIEIYETSSKKTMSQSSGRSESTLPFYGNLSNSTIVCNKIKSSYIDTIYTNDSEKNISSTTEIFENNTLNSGYSKHKEMYNVNDDLNNANNEKIVKNTIEHIPLLNFKEYDTYSTGNSSNKLIHCTPAISKSKISNFSNQTENTESTTLLFSLNSEFYINETNINKSMNMLNEKSTMMNKHNHEVNIKLENKSSSGTTYETLSQQSSGKDNIVDKPINDVNNKGYYFNKEISKENFKQTSGACNKSSVNFNDDVFGKCIRNSISVVYV